MSDRVELRGLRGWGRHGVLSAERRHGQPFLVDVALDVDVSAAAATDDLARTVDYSAVAAAVLGLVGDQPVDLIETLAVRLSRICLSFSVVDAATITVHKPHAPVGVPCDDVLVTVERRRPAPLPPRPAVLALGANLGDAAATLRQATAELLSVEGVDLVGVSPMYRSAPVGGVPQPAYLNLVVVVETTLGSEDLLWLARRVEYAHGRTRDVRWGPRTLDVDLVVVGEETVTSELLTLPHPRAHERAFVLRPWLDVDPQARLPGHGSVTGLLDGVRAGPGGQSDAVRVDDLGRVS
ncbi:MAG: 2-amino-4-hydroxy-6-hydroxymethyldihydropteridine diphosphokinase [Actinomycetes bacterium]